MAIYIYSNNYTYNYDASVVIVQITKPTKNNSKDCQ
jgi:hypothetical protein